MQISTLFRREKNGVFKVVLFSGCPWVYYPFPIDLSPNGILLGAKSIGVV